MALLVDKSLDNGIKLKSSYAKIGNAQGSKDYITFNLEYFYNRDLRIANKSPVLIEQYGFLSIILIISAFLNGVMNI